MVTVKRPMLPLSVHHDAVGCTSRPKAIMHIAPTHVIAPSPSNPLQSMHRINLINNFRPEAGDRMDVVAFQQKWIGASNLKEKSASQSHFNDLCDLLGVPKPLDADHVGDTYTFEKGAGIIGGGDGWADVWYKGHFAWEYKGRGKDLDAAYKQLLGYKDDLQNPPLMIVSDLNIIRIHTNFTNKIKRVVRVRSRQPQ